MLGAGSLIVTRLRPRLQKCLYMSRSVASVNGSLVSSQGAPNILLRPDLFQTETRRYKTNKGKGKAKGGNIRNDKSTIDFLLDELDDDEDEQTYDQEDVIHFKETPLSKFLKTSTKGRVKYEMFVKIVSGEALWSELEAKVESLKLYYVHQLSVRSSTSLDILMVELEGDMFPLNEIAGLILN